MIRLSEKAARKLADIELDIGKITKKEYNKKMKKYMKPIKALFG